MHKIITAVFDLKCGIESELLMDSDAFEIHVSKKLMYRLVDKCLDHYGVPSVDTLTPKETKICGVVFKLKEE